MIKVIGPKGSMLFFNFIKHFFILLFSLTNKYTVKFLKIKSQNKSVNFE